MSRLLAAALILLVLLVPVKAQEVQKQKAAVIDFEAGAGLRAESVMLSERLAQSLSALAGYDVVPRKDVWKAIVEAKAEKARYFDKPAEAAKLVKPLEAEKVFLGRAEKTGLTYVLHIRAVDVGSGKLISEHHIEHTGTIVDALSLTDILVLKEKGAYEDPVITTAELPEGRVGQPYKAKLEIRLLKKDKEKEKNIEWTVTDGSLPDGLLIVSNTITGTAEEPGTFTFTVRAGVETPHLKGGVEKIMGIKIKPAPLTLPDQKLPLGRVGHRYSIEPKPPTGTPPFKWEVLEGSLPRGVIFNTSTGKVEGLPGVTGTSRIKVSITDSLDPPETTTGWLEMEVTPPMRLLTTTLPDGFTGSDYSTQLEVENGIPPYKVSVSAGSRGLELTGSGKELQIHGRAGQSATDCRVTVQISDSTTPEAQKIEKNFDVKVKALHVAQVVSDDFLKLHDFRLDRGDVPVILASMKVLGSQASWVTFCRWSGFEWTLLPVTVTDKNGDYKILQTTEGPPAVTGFTETGASSEVKVNIYTPSDKSWLPEEVVSGNLRFIQAQFRPDGKLVFAYESGHNLYLIEKNADGLWQRELILGQVTELKDFFYSSAGTAYYIFLDGSGLPALLEKGATYSKISKLPDHPRCAGIDSRGDLRLYSSSLGDSTCYIHRDDGTFEKSGNWDRLLGANTIFSRNGNAAYSPAPLSGESADVGEFRIFCVSPIHIFSGITFDKNELRSRRFDPGSTRLAVDTRGNVHAAFIAEGSERGKGRILVYGRVTGRDEFKKIARAKSFVRLTSQRELSMPKTAPGINEKSGSCTLEGEGSSLTLIPVMLLVPLLLLRRKYNHA